MSATSPSTQPSSEGNRIDVLFIPSGGTGGIPDIASFYRTLHIPLAVIADLDLLVDRDKFRRTILAMNHSGDDAEDIFDAASSVIADIKRQPPSMSEDELRAGLLELQDQGLAWDQHHDINVKKTLRKFANRLDRMRKIKHGGIDAYAEHPAIRDKLVLIIDRCKALGLFLVPVGELEYWDAGTITDAPSKNKKSAWATYAAGLIRNQPDVAPRLKEFVEHISAFYRSEIQRISLLD